MIGFANNVSKERQYKGYCLISNENDFWKWRAVQIIKCSFLPHLLKCVQMLHILLLKENGKHSRMSIIPGYLAVPDISIGVLQYNSASDFVLVVALKNNDVFF